MSVGEIAYSKVKKSVQELDAIKADYSAIFINVPLGLGSDDEQESLLKDDRMALQAILDSAPNYATIIFPKPFYTIWGMLQLHKKLQFKGKGTNIQRNPTTAGNSGTVIAEYMNDSANLELDGVTLGNPKHSLKKSDQRFNKANRKDKNLVDIIYNSIQHGKICVKADNANVARALTQDKGKYCVYTFTKDAAIASDNYSVGGSSERLRYKYGYADLNIITALSLEESKITGSVYHSALANVDAGILGQYELAGAALQFRLMTGNVDGGCKLIYTNPQVMLSNIIWYAGSSAAAAAAIKIDDVDYGTFNFQVAAADKDIIKIADLPAQGHKIELGFPNSTWTRVIGFNAMVNSDIRFDAKYSVDNIFPHLNNNQYCIYSNTTESSKTAMVGTTTTNINIVGHGRTVGDVVWNSTRGKSRRVVTAIVDEDNFTVAAVTGQTNGDTIIFYRKLTIYPDSSEIGYAIKMAKSDGTNQRWSGGFHGGETLASFSYFAMNGSDKIALTTAWAQADELILEQTTHLTHPDYTGDVWEVKSVTRVNNRGYGMDYTLNALQDAWVNTAHVLMSPQDIAYFTHTYFPNCGIIDMSAITPGSTTPAMQDLQNLKFNPNSANPFVVGAMILDGVYTLDAFQLTNYKAHVSQQTTIAKTYIAAIQQIGTTCIKLDNGWTKSIKVIHFATMYNIIN